MTYRSISTRRLHILYTTPLFLSFMCIILILACLCGLVPWKQKSGTVFIIRRHSNSTDFGKNETASFHFGLLGSCFKPSEKERFQCTSIAFPANYDSTIAIAGNAINSDHLQISMPELPAVTIVWLLISIVAFICQIIGSLPIYSPSKLIHRRSMVHHFFTSSLWILGFGWSFGFSIILSLACFVQGFGDEYNKFSQDYFYNKASAGDIFYLMTSALVFQVIIGIELIVAICNATSEEKESLATSWANQFRVTGP